MGIFYSTGKELESILKYKNIETLVTHIIKCYICYWADVISILINIGKVPFIFSLRQWL